MRKIKFRIWDGADMHYPGIFSVSLSPLNEKSYISWAPENLGGGSCISECFMQYAGLKEKNGVEIYEGDILKFEIGSHDGTFSNHIGEVKWDDFCACFEVKTKTTEFLLDINEGAQVVGNIYENPELMSDE